MNMQELSLGFHEQVIFTLRSLYDRYGYSQYQMSKFEEYDLYARNKDFLISDSVITFTDANGKLMALKPDVTLSIVKNTKDTEGTVQKLYYNENVYRAAKGSRSFKELMQVGLECLGDIDDYCICEVLLLAAESLRSISKDCVLDISHLGLLSGLIDSIGVPRESKASVLKLIGDKNLHELAALCREVGVLENDIAVLKQLVSTSGSPAAVLPMLRQLLCAVTDTAPLEQLCRVTSALEASEAAKVLRIDFSVVDDIHYYNGIAFKGFIAGIPSSVLSGGQYDKLMRKMKRSSGAIGFAVYMDVLEQLNRECREYDVDAVLLYGQKTALPAIHARVKALTDSGCSVMVRRQLPENVKYKQLIDLRGGEEKEDGNNA